MVLRRTATTRDLTAGCFVCHGCEAHWTSPNAQALAARHHDRTGHATGCEVILSIRYGRDEPDPRQIDIEESIAAIKPGDRPASIPRTLPDAPAVPPAGVSDRNRPVGSCAPGANATGIGA